MSTAQTPNASDTGRSLKQRIEDRIERVDKGVRTPERDDAAREILRWQAEGEWPLNGPEMAERGEFSPQHYRNTIQWFSLDEDGFHNNDNDNNEGGGREDVETANRAFDFTIPEDVGDVRSYASGYIAGYLEGRDE